jgi:hypothetical protein
VADLLWLLAKAALADQLALSRWRLMSSRRGVGIMPAPKSFLIRRPGASSAQENPRSGCSLDDVHLVFVKLGPEVTDALSKDIALPAALSKKHSRMVLSKKVRLIYYNKSNIHVFCKN